jgi:hypothetical protein
MADAAFFYLMSSTRYRANRLGRIADPTSAKIAEKIVIPMREQVIVSHDGYRSNEEKGATVDPLMGVFPLAFEMTSEIEAATLKFYLGRSEEVSGQSHALSAVRSLGCLCGRLCSVRKANGGRVRPVLRRSILPDSRVLCGRIPTTSPCRPFLREPRRLLDDGAAPWLPRAAARTR